MASKLGFAEGPELMYSSALHLQEGLEMPVEFTGDDFPLGSEDFSSVLRL